MKPMEDKEMSLQDFKTLNEILERFDIHIWADLGTALGFIRDGDFIPWEEDIDVGCLESAEQFKKAEATLSCYGWKIFPKYSGLAIQNKRHSTKLDIKLYEDNGAYIKSKFIIYKCKKILPLCDFLLWMLNDYPVEYKYETIFSLDTLKFISKVIKFIPVSIKGFSIKWIQNIYYSKGFYRYEINIPKDLVLPLKTKNIRGTNFYIPNKEEKFLEFFYGEDWKTPMRTKGWDDEYTKVLTNDNWETNPKKRSRYLAQRVKERYPELVRELE
jgi:phosphorylcholine metabolism protein LicD